MESYRTFIRNNRVLFIGHVLIYAQGIILMPIIIKTAGVALYGGYILLYGLVGFTYGISSFGVGFKMRRFLPAIEERNERCTLFYPQFFFNLLSITLMSAIIILCYPVLDKVLFKGGIIFTRWLVFPYLISYFLYSQSTDYFLATHRVNRFNCATILFPYLNIAIVLLLYFVTKELSVNLLFTIQIASYLLISIPMVIMLVREIGFKIQFPNMKYLTEDIRLGFPLRLNYTMDYFLASSDKYLITYFMTVAAVGYYSPGYALGSLVVFFPRVMSVVLLPLLSKSVDTGKETEAHAMLNYAIKGFLLLAIPFVIASAVMSKDILILLGNAEVAQEAYMVTPIVALGTLFFGLNLILSNALWVRMKTSIMFKMNALAAIINIVLNVVLLYLYINILVAAFTTLLSYAIVFIFVYRAVNMRWALRFDFTSIVKSLIASLIMGVVLYWTSFGLEGHINGIWIVLGEVLIGVLVYILSLFAMRTFSSKEIIYFKKAFSVSL